MEHLPVARETDFFAWTQAQAAVLRRAATDRVNYPVEWENVAEELEDMGTAILGSLISDLSRIIEHLLKLEHSPAVPPRRGWGLSVTEHRNRVEYLLEKSPSLKRRLGELTADAWRQGRRMAERGLREGGLPHRDLPADIPYALADLLDFDWWPENRHGLDRDPG